MEWVCTSHLTGTGGDWLRADPGDCHWEEMGSGDTVPTFCVPSPCARPLLFSEPSCRAGGPDRARDTHRPGTDL